MAERWDRIESMARSVELSGGLEARIADPVWMLSRQWQVGEFRGDDAAQPAGVKVSWHDVPIATMRAGSDDEPVHPLGSHVPLEANVEAESDADLGAAGLWATARAGRRLVRALVDAGRADAVAALRATFPVDVPERLVTAGDTAGAAVDLVTRRAISGVALARAGDAAVSTALTEHGLTGETLRQTQEIVAAWRGWYESRGGAPPSQAWDAERLEYRVSLGARGRLGEVVLTAPEHLGGELDWYTFDLGGTSHGLTAEKKRPARRIAALPTPVRFAGMAAARWWEMEDGSIAFGALDAGPADLARLLVTEFALVYGDDWFVVPLRVPVGSLAEIDAVAVVDTFGGTVPVLSTAKVDALRRPGERVWRIFELTGDEPGQGHPSPWLFVPPSLAGALGGPVLERVAFGRDEAANLAWGVEQLVEGPLGRAVDRADAWHAAHPPASGPTVPDRRRAAGAVPWVYHLEATAPPWWIPFLPERVNPARSAEVRLRRARMSAWEALDQSQAGPASVLLDPRAPMRLLEEEVPVGGIVVERSWQLARWHDGSVHLWLQRRKRPGRGEPASGVRWDLLDLPDESP